MKQESEAVIQQEIYNWFNNNYCLKKHETSCIIYSVPNGTSTGDPRILKQMSLLGMVKGISDLKIEIPEGKIISVEVKNSIGKQSEHQIEMQNKVEKLGGIYLLVRSLEDFKNQISKHINWLTY
jgi:hypothetical protein